MSTRHRFRYEFRVARELTTAATALLLLCASAVNASADPEARFRGTGKADPIRITNVVCQPADSKGASAVAFDLAWDHSWRAAWEVTAEQTGGSGPLKLESWDAAWVFVKFRKPGDDGWSQATLSTGAADHSVPAGAKLDVGPTDDGKRGAGVFVYRAAAGSGANDFKGVTLRWLNEADGVADAKPGKHDTFGPADGRTDATVAAPIVLDRAALLKAHSRADDPWLNENVPFFECPDRDIEDIYYYRWWSYHNNIRWEKAFNGWTVHEGGGYGLHSCALGHHLYEGRWIKNRAYLNDYCRFWFAGSRPREYSTWFADGCYARYLVDWDVTQAASLLKGLVANQEAWEKERFDPSRGLFRWIPDRDGMEASLAGWEAGEADKFQWKTVIYGGDGYRPSLNSYMVADMRAIAAIASLAGDKATTEAYARKADALKAKIQQELWCREKKFFLQRRTKDYQFVSGREEIGFFPWAFHVPDHKPEYAEAWRQLQDPQGFKAKYGPTTLERRSPYFLRPFGHGCLWNGPSWPYSTSVTLAALANVLHDYRQDIVTRADYVALLHDYAVTQHDPDGKPMVREDHHPDEDRWLAKGGDYNHSRYCDLVITGLVGLRPRADNILEVNPLAPAGWNYFCLDGVSYHGRAVTILYDRTGNRYGKGAGLRVLIDGNEAAAAPTLGKITVAFESRKPPPPPPDNAKPSPTKDDRLRL